MRDFINKHPVLYWICVIVVAVAVFLLITLKGCMKLQRAEAAETSDGVYYPALLNEVDLGEYADEVDTILNNYTHVIVIKQSYSGYDAFTYVLNNGQYPYNPSSYSNPSAFDTINANAKISVWNKEGVWKCTGTQEVSGYLTIQVKSASSNTIADIDLIGSNYSYTSSNSATSAVDYVFSLPQNNLVHPNDYTTEPEVLPLIYSSDMPYVVFDSFSNDNLVLSDFDSKLELSQFDLKWQYTHKDYVTDNPCCLELTYYIWLPSSEYIRDYYNTYLFDYGIDLTVTAEMLTGQVSKDILAWQKKVGIDNDSVLYKMTRKIDISPGAFWDGSLSRHYDYKDIYDILEGQYGDGEVDFDFQKYYMPGDATTWSKYMRSVTFGHMYIARIDAVLYELADDATYYNGISTYTMLLNGVGVQSRVTGDIVEDENLEDIIEEEINESLRDLVGDLSGEVNDLQNQINNANNAFGDVNLDLDGNGLWSAIKSLGSGLLGLTGFLGSIATVFGRVFVFLPYDTQQIAGYFFMITLLVALWKLIKR